MKTAIIGLFAMAAIVAARPQDEVLATGFVPILRHQEIRDDQGQYALRYESADGTIVSERGTLKLNAEGDGHVLVKQGSVTYQSPDGTPVTFEYIADENGFQPKGSHIPVQPLVPTLKAVIGTAPELPSD